MSVLWAVLVACGEANHGNEAGAPELPTAGRSSEAAGAAGSSALVAGASSGGTAAAAGAGGVGTQGGSAGEAGSLGGGPSADGGTDAIAGSGGSSAEAGAFAGGAAGAAGAGGAAGASGAAGMAGVGGSVEPATCEGPATRIRYVVASASSSADCQPEVQYRTCQAGEWSAWTGANTFDECTVQGCPALPETRVRFAQAEVDYPAVCLPELQYRNCENGVSSPWSGSYTFENCVTKVKDCGATKHGQNETRTRYREAHVPFGGECEPQQQTRICIDGELSAWSGWYEQAKCEVALPAQCDDSTHGTVEERIRFAQAVVDDIDDCQSETQSRTCQNGSWSAWSGSVAFSELHCRVAPEGHCEADEQCQEGVCSADSCGCPEHQQLASCGGSACCECVTHWTGPSCETCPGNFDPQQNCNACRNFWSGGDCARCPANRSTDSDCTTCAPGWSGPTCEDQAVCVRFVDATSTASVQTGYSWSEAHKKISGALSAIALTGKPCQIWVRQGTYKEDLSPTAGTIIYGGFAGTEQSLSDRNVVANAVQVDGKVTGSASIDGVTFWGSVRATGQLTIRNSRFIRFAELQASAQVLVEDSEFAFEPNRDTHVVLAAEGADVLLRNVRISGAFSYGSGTAVTVRQDARVRLEASRVVGNYAQSYLLYVESGELELVNSVVTGNDITYRTGQLARIEEGALRILNSTVAGNTMSDGSSSSANLYVYGLADAEIVNSILWDSYIVDISPNVSVSHSIVPYGYEGGGNSNLAPAFVGSGPHPYMLTSDSPGIDAADGDLAPETDLLGAARFDAPSTPNTGLGTPGYVDMGAYEFH